MKEFHKTNNCHCILLTSSQKT